MIRAENISLTVGSRKILKPTTLEIPEGEFVVILGPNGAGKSTLLKMISGVQHSDTGYVSYDGTLLKEWKSNELATKRSFLLQNNTVFGDFTVKDIVEMGRFPHYSYKLSGFDNRICEEYLHTFNLSDRAGTVYNLLSGGEQQRIQFIRSLIQLEDETSTMNGKCLFLDEPLNNLDLQYQYAIMEQAKKSVVDRGGTVVCILHDFNIAFQYANRIIIVDQGEVVVNDERFMAMDTEVLSSIFNVKIESYTSPSGDLFFRTYNNESFDSIKNKINKVQSKIK
ncbi:MAG: ABC transporter ATP-binding protein [Flavobacteriia bacterium]|nr:ABC transporter ATP-binding protein [Flavobacteriia bacterium]OJX36743.1 MAG: hypothetical protein BGO87_13195 [Flavobacteriia bacterium 40-80]